MYRDGATRAPMKWWGWGEESISFTHEGKPELAPFIERHLELDVRRPGTRPIAFGDLDVPPSILPAGLTGRPLRLQCERLQRDVVERYRREVP